MLMASLMRLSSGWDDVGDFSSLADLLPAEANQPRVLGDSNFGMYPVSCLTLSPMLFRRSSHRAGCWWDCCSWVWTADCLSRSRRSRHRRHARHPSCNNARALSGSETSGEEMSRSRMENFTLSARTLFCGVWTNCPASSQTSLPEANINIFVHS